jgi:hypothetical protein
MKNVLCVVIITSWKMKCNSCLQIFHLDYTHSSCERKVDDSVEFKSSLCIFNPYFVLKSIKAPLGRWDHFAATYCHHEYRVYKHFIILFDAIMFQWNPLRADPWMNECWFSNVITFSDYITSVIPFIRTYRYLWMPL